MLVERSQFQLTEDTKMKMKFLLSLVVLAIVLSAMAQAGTDTTFDSWGDQMEEWLKGSLGKSVSIGFVIVGIIGAMARQSLMPFALGVGCALGMNYTPDVINIMFTATI